MLPTRCSTRCPSGLAWCLAAASLLVGLAGGLAAFTAPVQPPRGGLEGLDAETLLRQLAVADAAWTPRAERLPDGRVRYSYKRRQDDPPLSLAQVQALMARPPRFSRERAAIRELLAVLSQAGVRIQITTPRKPGAAGEWDPSSRTLRVRPSVLRSGSADLARVLNHEAIHVAQSCRNGGLTAQPRPLGLSHPLPPALEPVLAAPPYRQASAQEQRLEREAYAAQDLLALGVPLLRSQCRL